ncbi:MAG: hypothetical protein PQJ49_11140 [Sphaerochaetaceae bacterium]|nr:hypothetical protein [Sphaerochaetaceae bacterium]
MGAKSYILDQFNSNVQKGLDTGLSAMDLLVTTEVKNNQDHFATQISEALDYNVYSNPNTKEWDHLSNEVFNTAEKNIEALSITDAAKYRLKQNVVEYSKASYNSSLDTKIEKTNLYKLANELNNTMKLDASNNKLSITDAYNNYADSFNESNELAISHGIELTKPSDYLDILISTKSEQYVSSALLDVPNNFLNDEGKAITPDALTNQVIENLSTELSSISSEPMDKESLANINSLVVQAYNQKMGELTQAANNSKLALLGEISKSKGMYDVSSLESYFDSNYPPFIKDTVGKDLIDIANYKNDSLIITDLINKTDITQEEIAQIKTPELKSDLVISIASNKLRALIEPNTQTFKSDSDIYNQLGVELNSEERKTFEKQIVDKLTPGKYKSSTENPIITALNNSEYKSASTSNSSSNNVGSNAINTKLQQTLESDRLNPFITDEEMDQTIFKYVQSGHLSVEEGIKYSNRPNFIDGISTEISTHIDSIYSNDYGLKDLTENEKSSIKNSLRKSAYQLYLNDKPKTSQEWETYYLKVNRLAKKETVNTFFKEMDKVKKTLNNNDFMETFENSKIDEVLTQYQQGDLDFYVNPEQLDSLLFELGAFDLNQDEYASVGNIQNSILKNYYDNQEFDDLNKVQQTSIKATATIAFATRQERQLVNSFFDLDFMEPTKVGNRFAYKLEENLYVSLISYNNEPSIKDGTADFLLISPKEGELSINDFSLNNYSNRLITLNSKYTVNGSEEERSKIINSLKKDSKTIKGFNSKPNETEESYDNPATYMIDKDGNKISLKPSTNNNLVKQNDFERNLEQSKVIESFNAMSARGKELETNINNQAKKIQSESEYLKYSLLDAMTNDKE